MNGKASSRPIVFVGARIFDGSGSAPFAGELRIEGERITQVAKPGERVSREGARVIEADGKLLMPGLVEAHAHLTWPSSIERFVPGMHLPIEDLALNAARNARILLDHGFTSAFSAGALARTIEPVLARAIGSGGLPGPRLVPSTIEREPPGSGTDHGPGTVEEHASGPEGVRAFIRDSAAAGAKAIKFLLNGESALVPGSSQQLLYAEEEVKAAGEQARESDVWLTAHAQASDAVKMAVRHGFRIIYHCTYADEEALDMLEAARERLFMGPAVGIVQATLDANPPPGMDMTYMKQNAAENLELMQKVVPALRKRGVRVLPGGDYGFPFNPTGRNAWDLELFVRHFGYTPAEALHAATALGGELMGQPDALGRLKPGFLADLLLVDGDPTQDVRVLQDKQKLQGIMKGGVFHKDPAWN